MTDWRDRLRELGFGNQAVIVGTKRRELFDEIEKIRKEERQKVLDLLVDEKLTVVAHKYGTETGEIEATIGDGEEDWKIPRNELRAELRQQIKEMK